MSRLRRRFLHNRDIFVTVAYLAVILATPQSVFAWGREGQNLSVELVRWGQAAALPAIQPCGITGTGSTPPFRPPDEKQQSAVRNSG
jgi:hypothetical protein